ncbi:peptidase S28 [Lenzites betulinus]|nr:peptidase S28 [Lenzites betulinus]
MQCSSLFLFLFLWVPLFLRCLVYWLREVCTISTRSLTNLCGIEKPFRKLPPFNTTYYFDQLIDHANPNEGTFEQRYWLGYQYYEPGGPIVVLNPGESDASVAIGYLSNLTITGIMAERFNGAVVILEQRFFGESNPYPDLSVKSFRVHTLEQAIDDLEYFSKNNVAPGNAPWILAGGSYAGALTSYAMHSKPDLFHAGYSSSGVVQAQANFWGYFKPIMEYMPKNCSSDVQAVTSAVDQILLSGNRVTEPIQTWQDLMIGSSANSYFYDFCDQLEMYGPDNATVAGPEGWGLEHALNAWGAFYEGWYIPTECPTGDIEACFSTFNSSSPEYTNIEVNNFERSWTWLQCTVFGFSFDGALEGQPSLVSRTLNRSYNEASFHSHRCKEMFPEAFNTSGPVTFLNALDVNMKYDGWNTTTERLIFVNGERDPWRAATVAVEGAVNNGSDLQPHLIADGFHTSDMVVSEGFFSPRLGEVQVQALSYLQKWLSEWQPSSS